MKEREVVRVGDGILLALAIGLAVFGVAMIYSAGKLEIPSSVTGIWVKQAVWLAISLVAFALVQQVGIRWLEWLAPATYALSIFGLIAVLVIGVGPGPRSWIRFGGVGFQPSEFAKLATILMLARIVAGRERSPDNLWDLWPHLAVVVVPALLIIAQPDLGTASVFIAILMAALYWSGLPTSRLLMVLSPFVSLALAFSTPVWGLWFLLLLAFLYRTRAFLSESVAVMVANVAMGVLVHPFWDNLANYQKLRILAFLEPQLDPQGAGWHLIQSQVAIGSGGWLGKGFAAGTQKRLAFLPEQHTDFIVAVVGEELGFIGIAIVLLAFAIILTRVLKIAEQTTDRFASMVVFGIFACWFTHLVSNIGMTVGLFPITGVPLLFLSYGGSFLLVAFVSLAIIQRVAAESKAGP